MSINSTLRIIKKYANNSTDIVVDFSGGRYSIVLLHLTLKALKKTTAVYIDTTISLPECNQFVKEICDSWGVDLIILKRKDVDFWELVKRRGFPHRRFRWCMKEFKTIPLRLFNMSYDGEILHLTGTSKHESSFRKKVYDIRGYYHYNYSIYSFVLHPLLDWTEPMIYDYIKKFNLPINPCYDKYYSSGNCYYCPFISSLAYYLNLANLQPKLFSKIIEAEKAMKKGGGAIYLGKGKVLHLSNIASKFTLESLPKKAFSPLCEARATTKTLFIRQKKCLM